VTFGLHRARRPWLLAAVSTLLALSSCATWKSGPSVALRVECNVPDATVWVDDVLVGTAANWKAEGKFIRAGFHRLEVRHPGYYSHFQEVDLPTGGKVVVTAKLEALVE
jgi:hypothetical protein